VAQPRASDVAYARLREMILDLRLPPGSVVNEQELATKLELGRMPVREAIARLASDSRPAGAATMISHAELLAALETRSPERAEQAMRGHIAASRQLLQSSF
jgi:DNA-binding GntR family transcriptional regulator